MSKSMQMEPWLESTTKLFFRSHRAKAHFPPSTTNLSGQVAVVTGANAGLGLVACRQLLSFRLSTLILAVRSQKKGDEAAAALRKEHPGADVKVWLLDMNSYESISAFASRCGTVPRLDAVILNAGITKQDRDMVEGTGHEEVYQVNYLSTVLLSALLVPVMRAGSKSRAGRPGRITVVSSGMAFAAKVPNQDAVPFLPTFDSKELLPWDPAERYSCSKLIGLMFLQRLSELVDGDSVVINMVDPGLCRGTQLHRDIHGIAWVFMRLLANSMGRPVADGASTYVDAAFVQGKETHGSFVMDWAVQPFPLFMYSEKGRALSDRLWDETLSLPEFAPVRPIIDDLTQGLGPAKGGS